MRAIRMLLAVVLFGAAAVRWEPSVTAQTGALTLGLTVNTATITPGDTLVAGVTVNNPGNGPLADFYFVIVLPDGATVVSAGPGVGARFGTIGNLRSLVPVVRGISLATAFPYQASSFFSYTFSGIEPLGTYRLYFVAARTGAFDDGAINGGDLLAVASRDITVANSPIVVDTARAVTSTVSTAGGSVQATAAGGAELRLTVLPGGLNAPRAITIAPLTAFAGLPSGPLVAGIAAEPSGLRFVTPATLAITLPPGFQVPPFGLTGFIADNNGGNLRTVAVTVVGNVATMLVPHFSVAGVSIDAFWLDPCTDPRPQVPSSAAKTAACAQLRPIYDAEVARLAAEGGALSSQFLNAVIGPLAAWMQNGILPQLLSGETAATDRPLVRVSDLSAEFGLWLDLYRPLFGLRDRTNEATGLPLGASIDLAQDRFRLALLAGMNAENILCLAEKSRVDLSVSDVGFYAPFLWSTQGPEFGTPPFQIEYCVGIRIDAAPPPVLTPGQAALFPVDVRLRFTDGVDLPGRQAAVTVTATNGTVTPAGGVVTLPLATNLTLLPTAPGGTVTISAAMIDPSDSGALEILPVRTRTFQAGQSAPTVTLVVTSSGMAANIDSELPTRPRLNASDVRSTFAEVQTVTATMNEQVTNNGTTFRISSLGSATRNVSGAGGGVTIVGTFRSEPGLSAQPALMRSEAQTAVSSSQGICFELPRTYQASYSVQSDAQADPSNRFNTQLTLVSGATQRAAIGGESGTVVLPASNNACIRFTATAWTCLLNFLGEPQCDLPNPLTGRYTVSLQPLP